MLTNREQTALVCVAAISLVLASGLISYNVQLSAAQLVDNSTNVVMPGNEPAVDASEVDILLEQANATWVAVTGLISTAMAIIVYILNAIKSRTGDKIISAELMNRVVDVTGIVKQKSDELTDVFRQQLEDKQRINAYVDVIKSLNPEIAKKIDETLPEVNKRIQNEIRPQTEEWRRQAGNWYDTIVRKESRKL